MAGIAGRFVKDEKAGEGSEELLHLDPERQEG